MTVYLRISTACLGGKRAAMVEILAVMATVGNIMLDEPWTYVSD